MDTFLLFNLAYILGTILFIRGLLLAIGKVKKLYANENFLLWQKIGAILFASNLFERLFYHSWGIYYAIISLVLLGIFYLQPTPRISKIILILFSITTLAYFVTDFRLVFVSLLQLVLGFY